MVGYKILEAVGYDVQQIVNLVYQFLRKSFGYNLQLAGENWEAYPAEKISDGRYSPQRTIHVHNVLLLLNSLELRVQGYSYFQR